MTNISANDQRGADLRLTEAAFWIAGENWLLWKPDYESERPVSQMPVLKLPGRYRAFLKTYSLLRYLPGDEREQIRKRLYEAADFEGMTHPQDGSGVDEFAHRLNKDFPGFEIQRSFVSKLAAFARPDVFVAWDRFARRGVARITGGPESGNYENYATYLTAVNTAWNSGVGYAIRHFLSGKAWPTEKRDDGFPRRVLDVYLMIRGGRWSVELETGF